MNILLLSHGFLPGHKEATKITITEFKRQLVEEGHNVVLIAERSISETIKKVKKVQEELGAEFDIVHGFSAAPIIVMKTMLVKKNTSPKAKTIHTLKSYSKNLFGGLGTSFLLNMVDVVTVSTEIFRKRLIHRGCLPSKIKVIRSHIDLRKFLPLDKNILKHNYGLSGKIVLYYGSLHENKGPQFLAEAMDGVDATLLLAPRHKVSEEFQELLDESVIVITEDIDVTEYVNMADVLVLPYKNMKGTEGNPSCLLEAMACKTPVITSDLPELLEIVSPEKDVLMTSPGDVTHLRRQIQRVLTDTELKTKMVTNSFEKTKEFDVRKVTKGFLSVYES